MSLSDAFNDPEAIAMAERAPLHAQRDSDAGVPMPIGYGRSDRVEHHGKCNAEPHVAFLSDGRKHHCDLPIGHDGEHRDEDPNGYAWVTPVDDDERTYLDIVIDAAEPHSDCESARAELAQLRATAALVREWGAAWLECEPINAEINKAVIGSVRASALWRNIQEPQRRKDAAFKALHESAITLAAQGAKVAL